MRLLPLALALAFCGGAFAADLDFTLINKTARSFEGIYVSATNDRDWDGNLLPHGAALAAEGRIEVKFDPSEKSETWDVRVVDADGIAVTFQNVKLSVAHTLTLEIHDGKITAVAE